MRRVLHLQLLSHITVQAFIIRDLGHIPSDDLAEFPHKLIMRGFCVFNRVMKQRSCKNFSVLNFADVPYQGRDLDAVPDIRTLAGTLTPLATMLVRRKLRSPEN